MSALGFHGFVGLLAAAYERCQSLSWWGTVALCWAAAGSGCVILVGLMCENYQWPFGSFLPKHCGSPAYCWIVAYCFGTCITMRCFSFLAWLLCCLTLLSAASWSASWLPLQLLVCLLVDALVACKASLIASAPGSPCIQWHVYAVRCIGWRILSAKLRGKPFTARLGLLGALVYQTMRRHSDLLQEKVCTRRMHPSSAWRSGSSL